MPPHRPTHVQKKHHGDHDLIVGRLEQYIKAYRTGKPEAMMEFYHPDNFIYSDFSADRHGLGHKEVKDTYKKTFSNFHDLEIRTMSVHGHKDFTAWEWEITFKPAVDNDTGARIAKEDAVPKMLVGCTLMWWEGGKIVRNHDYVQTRDV
ncbi:hypothetical protein EKO04_010519 [Ascochyta lentis]|uniref:SnoaL-like domain-containing protein n=1 Tax=Ascochyta lentis TaxID=205686 RepID=A0A8H7MFZ4_9PLEO|nr:hypothetical protein EKO04_010519 [Ascochyta lentis]